MATHSEVFQRKEIQTLQKDVHFYLTYVLARKAGIPISTAKRISWANQYTDDLTEAELHGIQTQSDIVGNWGDRQIQLSVLVPFHFIPGNDPKHPWMTLHGLQDSFSHETFSGWREDLNSCFPWYFVKSGIPNVGHAELRVVPDVVNYVWTDPRSGKRVDNKLRTMAAAKATFDFLAKFFGPGIDKSVWATLKPKLRDIFRIDSYDRRIDKLCVLSGTKTIDYAVVNRTCERVCKSDFIRAASNHLSAAVKSFEDLPRPR